MFRTELFRRALAGEHNAIAKLAHEASRFARRLEYLTDRQRKNIEQVAAISVFWPVNVTVRDTDFVWAKKYVRGLKVGSKSLLRAVPKSRIERHKDFARLAERLWLQLLKNRHKLPELLEKIGKAKARKPKWTSLCLSLPAARTSREVSPQDAPTLWQLGEALLQDAWEQDRQAAFGSVLLQYEGKYTEAFTKRDIFKRFGSAFIRLLGHGRKGNSKHSSKSKK